MREYAKVAPTFWTGTTGKELRRRGIEGVIVGLYLMTSPHSNMLGLYYQPKLYLAHETGLGIEGASKGLAMAIDAGFCKYDEALEVVWVPEMAAYQIADDLKATDKRCAGIQKDYDALPNNPFLGEFFDRYAGPFNLKRRRTFEGEKQEVRQAPSKPHRSQEQEQEQEHSEAKASAAGAATSAGADPKPLTAKDRLWALGVPLLGDKARPFLGKLVATYGDDLVAKVLAEATTEQPVEPKAWVVAACEAQAESRSKAKNGGNGFHAGHDVQALLERDQHPQWVVDAGFEDIWQAENAGCFEANYRKFGNGRRIA